LNSDPEVLRDGSLHAFPARWKSVNPVSCWWCKCLICTDSILTKVTQRTVRVAHVSWTDVVTCTGPLEYWVFTSWGVVLGFCILLHVLYHCSRCLFHLHLTWEW
jgi:hypothetical protein